MDPSGTQPSAPSDAPPLDAAHSPSGRDDSEQMVAPELPVVAGQEAVPSPSHPPRKGWRRWRLKRDWPILCLIAILIGGWLIYAVVLPPLEIRHKMATTRWKYSRTDPEISISIRVMLRTCEYWFMFWFLYLGASIGSFINVVASRTPRGKTIVTRGSHCPFCDSPLNLIDNSPVFGWLLLRGRCRRCHLPIAPRYVWMEVALGLIFMILAGIELFSNGYNLPHRDWKIGAGIVYTVFYPKWDLIGAYVAHCSLFSIALMLIATQMDRLRFPALPLAVFAALYAVAVSCNRALCSVRWYEPFGSPQPYVGAPWFDQAITAGLGGIVGACLGSAFAILLARFLFATRSAPSVALDADATGDGDDFSARIDREQDMPSVTTSSAWRWHYTVLCCLAGTLLGWQAIAVIAPVSAVITLLGLAVMRFQPRMRDAAGSFLSAPVIALAVWTITLFLHHVGWRQIAHWLHIG